MFVVVKSAIYIVIFDNSTDAEAELILWYHWPTMIQWMVCRQCWFENEFQDYQNGRKMGCWCGTHLGWFPRRRGCWHVHICSPTPAVDKGVEDYCMEQYVHHYSERADWQVFAIWCVCGPFVEPARCRDVCFHVHDCTPQPGMDQEMADNGPEWNVGTECTLS